VDIREALDVVRASPDLADFVGPRDESLIAAAEETLGLRFPPSYRTFVAELGAGSFGGEELYGVISDDASGIPEAVWMTLEARRDWGLPSSMIVVYFDGGIDYFVLDTAAVDARGEAPVRVVTPGLSDFTGELPVVESDFGALFAELVSEQLQED